MQRPASQAEERLLSVLYPKPDGNKIQLTDDQRALIVEHKRTVARRGEIEKQATDLSARIKEFLGTKSFGFVGKHKVVSWAARKDGVRVLNNFWKDND